MLDGIVARLAYIQFCLWYHEREATAIFFLMGFYGFFRNAHLHKAILPCMRKPPIAENIADSARIAPCWIFRPAYGVLYALPEKSPSKWILAAHREELTAAPISSPLKKIPGLSLPPEIWPPDFGRRFHAPLIRGRPFHPSSRTGAARPSEKTVGAFLWMPEPPALNRFSQKIFPALMLLFPFWIARKIN